MSIRNTIGNTKNIFLVLCAVGISLPFFATGQSFTPVKITSQFEQCLVSGSKAAIGWHTEQIDHVAIYFAQQQVQPQSGAWLAHPVYGTSYEFTVPSFQDWRRETAKQIYIEGHLADHAALGGDWSNYFQVRDEVCDFIPPSPPKNVRVTGRTNATVTLAWEAAADNSGGSGVGQYDIYIVLPDQNMSIDQVMVEELDGVYKHTIYLEKVGGKKGTSLYVEALDKQGNRSGPSNIVIFDLEAPPAAVPPKTSPQLPPTQPTEIKEAPVISAPAEKEETEVVEVAEQEKPSAPLEPAPRLTSFIQSIKQTILRVFGFFARLF